MLPIQKTDLALSPSLTLGDWKCCAMAMVEIVRPESFRSFLEPPQADRCLLVLQQFLDAFQFAGDERVGLVRRPGKVRLFLRAPVDDPKDAISAAGNAWHEFEWFADKGLRPR